MINLVPISQIVKATKIGKSRLAYLTKLRLLPQTIRQKVGNHIEGYYPNDTINRLAKIENLKDAGLTYSQIRFQLAHEATVAPNYSPALFLLLGLVLGYLFATVPLAANRYPLTANNIFPLDQQQKSMVTIMTAQNGQGNEPIYLIAVPKQNFSKLGQTSLSELTK